MKKTDEIRSLINELYVLFFEDEILSGTQNEDVEGALEIVDKLHKLAQRQQQPLKAAAYSNDYEVYSK